MKIEDIRAGTRYRKDLGDVAPLAESIRTVGLLHPVVVLEDGTLVAGERRIAAARLLGWTEIPTRVVTQPELDQWLVRAERDENLVRKALTPSEAVAIARVLRPVEEERAQERERAGKAPSAESAEGRSGESRVLVARAVGMSHDKLAKAEAVVAAAEADPVLAHLVERMDQTGKVDPVHRILIAAKEIKRHRRQERDEARLAQQAEAVAENHPLDGTRYRLIHGDLAVVADSLASGSIDAIVTDPPYGKAHLDCYEKLATIAPKVLKPGAPCIVMVGQAHLHEILGLLSAKLTYVWTLAYLTPGQSVQVFGRGVKSNWKPVLWFTNGKGSHESVVDVVTSDSHDKRFHDWGQSVSGMARLIEQFSIPQALVLDPFCGAGTTGVAALATGRLFVGIDIDKTSIALTAKRLGVM